MTVGASPVVHEPHCRRVAWFRSRATMCRRMALLAEAGPRNLEHPFLVAAVRVVAGRAALDDRYMLPEERPALLSVATVAGFVHRAGEEHLVVRRAVGVMAARALHLPFTERHVREPRQLCLLLRVAVGTGLDHRLLFEVAALRRSAHHGVTVGTRDIARFVRAPFPERSRCLLVAVEARRVALGNRGLRLAAE